MKRALQLLFSFVTLLALDGFRPVLGAAHVTMYTDQCTAGTDYFEFQLNITNSSTAGETLYINSPGIWRITHASAIVPTGTNTFSLNYVAGSCDTILSPLFTTPGTTYTLSYNPSTRLMQCNFSNVVLGNHAAAVNAPVLPGQTISGGRYRLTITSGIWTNNVPVGLSWSGTTSGLVAYIDSNASTTAFNTTANRTLDTMCVMTTPVNTGLLSGNSPDEISVYPNPASDRLYVSGVSASGIAVLMDMEGKSILEMKVSREVGIIDLQGIAYGTYLLTISDGEKLTRRRIVVQ